MKYSFIILCIGIVLICNNCKKTDTDPMPVICVNINKINLKSPVVGQSNQYLMFDGKNHGRTNASYTYLEDTLIVRVLSADQNQYILEEYFTSGSKEIKDWTGYINYQNNANKFIIQIDGDTLRVKDLLPFLGSKLFHSIEVILITTEQKNNLGTKRSWFIQPNNFESFQYGYLEKFNVGNQYFDRANFMVDYQLTLVDGPGYELIYDEHCSIIYSSVFGPETGSGYGFELLP